MKTISLAVAALFALSCAACHSEETRNKIDNLEAEQAAQGASNGGPEEATDSAKKDGNSAD